MPRSAGNPSIRARNEGRRGSNSGSRESRAGRVPELSLENDISSRAGSDEFRERGSARMVGMDMRWALPFLLPDAPPHGTAGYTQPPARIFRSSPPPVR